LKDIGKFLPFEISDRIIPMPAFMNRFGKEMKEAYEKAIDAIPEHVLYTFLLTTAVWALCYYLHKRRDL
jgi:ABC-2 type transport system permease protein